MRRYSFVREGGILIFRTSHFSEDRSSVLHSGIYNRELASLLAAGGVIAVGVALLIEYIWGGIFSPGLFGLRGTFSSLGVFILLFLFFRVAVFRERELAAIFDRQGGWAEIETQHLVGKKKTASVSAG